MKQISGLILLDDEKISESELFTDTKLLMKIFRIWFFLKMTDKEISESEVFTDEKLLFWAFD